jgi:hypothetical protein
VAQRQVCLEEPDQTNRLVDGQIESRQVVLVVGHHKQTVAQPDQAAGRADVRGGPGARAAPDDQFSDDLSFQHRRHGRTWGTNDPGVDPNVGGTGEWRRMERVQR